MTTTQIGFLAGALSGALMGIISHVCFRFGLFKSSLIVIDGTFFFQTIKVRGSSSGILGAGLIIHLLTSGVFGAVYTAATGILGLNLCSLLVLGLYVFLLWLSMLFIALPVAGAGILGRKSGPLAWFEQLILHAIFFILYYVVLRGLL